jgi:hypothetical protein
MRKHALGLALAACLLSQACTLQTFALRSIDVLFDNTLAAFMEEGDLRLAEQGIAGNLKLLDGIVKTDPDNERFLLLSCMGYASYALAFADDDPQRALLFYTRAWRYGIRGLRLHGIREEVFTSSAAAMRQALAKLGKGDVPLVFWTANAWGNAVHLQLNDPDAIASLPAINAMMEWVIRQDPGYFYGGAYLYFGAYYSSLPPALGGRPDLAKENFERAIAASGGKFLMTYVFYAKMYAVEVQDAGLFQSLLDHVITSPVDVLPEQRMANVVAKARARQALAGKDGLF